MKHAPRKVAPALTALALTALILAAIPARAQQQPSTTQSQFTLKVNSDLVLTNVVVRDKKSGAVVRGLTAKDFTILENGKPQRISSFDFESVDQAAQLNEATIVGQNPAQNPAQPAQSLFNAAAVASPQQLRDHRLIVLFFDLTSMQPDDIIRAQQAARNYINKQMQPADIVAAVSLDTDLSIDQDFTQNKQLLLNAINRYSGATSQGFAPGATSTTNQVEDATAFSADESEFNDLNTDRELFAITSIAKSLAYINEKKSMLYFSGGIQRDGIENQASLRSAINSAVRSNLAIYSVDTRGLQAISPLGDASTGSLRGANGYNGAALQNNFDSNFNTQEVMATLSSDTGGKAFFDTNDFAPAFTRIQNDTSAYYVLGYRSTNPRRDGRYRRLTVKIDRPGLRIEYRHGYYAPADYKHSNREQREQQLEDELASALPATDMAVYLQAWYFRTSPGHYYIPVSLVVPGSQIPFIQGGDKDKATLDIIGEVKDSSGHVIGQARQTVKLKINQSEQVRRKNVQYSTGFNLPTGKYHLKFVVRENETGHMGSFEADINVPDLRKLPLKMSSVVLATQRIPVPKRDGDNPLVHDGQELVPNLPHVFRQNQHLYFLYEVYSPAGSPHDKTKTNVLTSIEFLRNGEKAFETPLVQATKLNEPGRDAIAFQFDVPLSQLKPGQYTCQVNVIDDTAGSFTFPRTAILIHPPAAAPAQAPAAPPQKPASGN
ncbi:MAG TPA: VWA domain-containing protein [Acidobacteriaceae bacterium]|nr:VWA domain-containing protein [Acidobacteriaceae bacterium]